MLPLRPQIFVSLAEESEAVEEARSPRRVARISGFPWCLDGVFCCCLSGFEGSTVGCAA
jgi:hypothetical protein